MFFEVIDNNVKQKYYYLWNQIEIIGIVKQNDEVMVTYSCEAYGNILSIDETLSSTIGAINLFVYEVTIMIMKLSYSIATLHIIHPNFVVGFHQIQSNI